VCFSALRPWIGIASGSGSTTRALECGLGGGVGTCDSVWLATGFAGDWRAGSGMRATGFTTTAPMPAAGGAAPLFNLVTE